LPERLSDRFPPIGVELAIGFLLGAIGVGIRSALTPALGDLAPYAMNFVAMTAAAVIGGWRAGLIALVTGQVLAWFTIVGHADLDLQPGKVPTLVVATLTEFMVLAIIGLYQREVDKGTAEREQRLRLLDDALKEIDHRTHNNYQTVLAMLALQARRATDDGVRQALHQASDRVQAVAKTSQQLTRHSAGLDAVRLDDHLCGLVEQLGRGLARDGIEIDCDVDEVVASSDAATSISIIVNELVTNAIKHAFNGEGSGHVRVIGKTGSGFELTVTDNGRGIRPGRRNGRDGLGTRLVESFARQLDAQHEVVSNDKGTTHRLTIPTLT
jgi:two-component sensor histidine kinase